MALGAMPGTSWEQRTVQMARGDTLVLYSDGIIDTQDETGAFFGEERLRRVITANGGHPADQVLGALLQVTQKFSGEATQFDDMTVMVVVRDT